jgi:hypothetical protein
VCSLSARVAAEPGVGPRPRRQDVAAPETVSDRLWHGAERITAGRFDSYSGAYRLKPRWAIVPIRLEGRQCVLPLCPAHLPARSQQRTLPRSGGPPVRIAGRYRPGTDDDDCFARRRVAGPKVRALARRDQTLESFPHSLRRLGGRLGHGRSSPIVFLRLLISCRSLFSKSGGYRFFVSSISKSQSHSNAESGTGFVRLIDSSPELI